MNMEANEHESVTRARGEGRVHPTATVGEGATVGEYATVGERATVGGYASVGGYATVGEGATVGKDATVGEFATVGEGARVDTFDVAGVHGNYAWSTESDATGVRMLRYGCEAHPIDAWTPELRASLCARHDLAAAPFLARVVRMVQAAERGDA